MNDPLLHNERAFLDEVYHTYRIEESAQDAVMRQLTVRTFSPYLTGGIGLELGCSDGVMTQMLATQVDRLDVVDGSRKFLRKASQRSLPNVQFIYSLFEEFETKQAYDYVFASYVLEHVIDPQLVLRKAHEALSSSGLLFVTVPNARALSRQLALHMGLLPDLKHLTQNDRNHGHRRVYDRVALNRDLLAAGFETINQGGLMLKLLADFQMDQLLQEGILKPEHVEGLFRLGLEYPDLCGSIFSICRKQ